MSLSRNLVAGLAASGWSALISLAVIPAYLNYLGIAAYGLIGFFGALQALFAVLDLGMTPAINREVARGVATGDMTESRRLLRAAAWLSWTLAALIAVGVFMGGPAVAAHWLRTSSLPPIEVERAVILMGMVVACRWPNGVYSSALVGTERIVLVSCLGGAMATLSAIGAVIVLAFFSPTIEAFFIWQSVVALAQTLATRWLAWRSVGGRGQGRLEISALKRIWKFSAGLGVSGLLGLILLQSDKIVLSRLVPLDELGRYTLAGLGSRILYILLTPVFTAVYPRMSALVATQNEVDLVKLYRNGTRLLVSIISPAALYISFFSSELFQLWTGNRHISGSISITMTFLTLGTALNGAMHFPHALQLSFGAIRLPLAITGCLTIIYIPLVIFLTLHFGISGASAAWFILNLVYLFFGTWLTHRAFLRNIGGKWILWDVMMPMVGSIFIIGTGRLAVKALKLQTVSALSLGMIFPILTFMIIVMASTTLAEIRKDIFGRTVDALSELRRFGN